MFFFAETSTTKRKELLPKLPPKTSQRQPQKLKKRSNFYHWRLHFCYSACHHWALSGIGLRFFSQFFPLSASEVSDISWPALWSGMPFFFSDLECCLFLFFGFDWSEGLIGSSWGKICSCFVSDLRRFRCGGAASCRIRDVRLRLVCPLVICLLFFFGLFCCLFGNVYSVSVLLANVSFAYSEMRLLTMPMCFWWYCCVIFDLNWLDGLICFSV